MPISVRPFRRFPVQCAVTYHAHRFLKLPLAYFLWFWVRKARFKGVLSCVGMKLASYTGPDNTQLGANKCAGEYSSSVASFLRL